MNLAIATQGPELSSPLAENFESANYLILVDPETGNNEFFETGQGGSGAGSGAHANSQALIGLRPEGLITLSINPQTASALKSAHVAVYTTEKSRANEALQDYREGKLQTAS